MRACATTVRNREAIGNRAFQNGGRIYRVGRLGETIEESPGRAVTPQILERDDAPGERRGRHAEHGLVRAQLKTRRHRPLPTANELSMNRLPYTQRVYVDTTSRRRPEANDEMDLRTRDQDAWRVAIALVHE